MKNTKIPWTGVVLGLLYFLSMVGLIYNMVREITIYVLTFIVLQGPDIGAKLISDLPGMIVGLVMSIVIVTLLMAGIFYGSRLGGLILSLIFEVMALILMVINISKTLMQGSFKPVIIQLIFLAILMFSLWLIIKCLKHPYYKGNNQKFNFRSKRGWKEFIFGNPLIEDTQLNDAESEF